MNALIKAKKIFTGNQNHPWIENGFVRVQNGIIVELGHCLELTPEDQFYDYSEATLCPGFIDTHCFFIGYAFSKLGVCLEALIDKESILSTLINSGPHIRNTFIGRNVGKVEGLNDFINLKMPKEPVVLFHDFDETLTLNDAAKTYYGLDSGNFITETLWPLLKEMISDTAYVRSQWADYEKLMNSRGITTTKEMIFDDGYGLLNVLRTLDEQLLRVHFMSQPVSKPLDLEFGKAAQKNYSDDLLCFSGFNQMTDGSIGVMEGDLKAPYEGETVVRVKGNYDTIREDVLAADRHGIRHSLHAQGDGAIARCVDIYSQCQRQGDGKLILRHAITDLELVEDTDADRMGWLGVIAEIYPQIHTLYNSDEKLRLISSRVGAKRSEQYWNRRALNKAGVVMSCATDLPLLVPNIPESMICACGGFFLDSKEPFNSANGLSKEALLSAWTYGGAYNLGIEKNYGTIEVGKVADFAIVSGDLETTYWEGLKECEAIATYMGSKGFVYKK